MPRLIVPTLLLSSLFALGACTGEALESDPVSAEEPAAEAAGDSGKLSGEDAGAATGPAPAQTSSAQPAAARPAPARPAPEPVCDTCGTVAGVEPLEVRGKGSGAGAVGGAVAGGVLGHQIGSGSGNKIATVVGALAGGYAGHKAEERIRTQTAYRVTVRMESGGTRTFEMSDASHLSPGQKVTVHGDQVIVRN